MSFALIALAAVVTLATALYWYYPETTRKWFGRFLWTRRVAFALLLLLFAVTLLSTGIGYLVLAGAVILGAMWLYVLVFTDIDVPRPSEVWPLSEVL